MLSQFGARGSLRVFVSVIERLTASGTRRLDVLTPQGLAIESKVGRTSLSKATRQQIQRDVELMNDPLSAVASVEWHFAKSPITGRGGSTGPLEAALRAAGIGIR